MDNSSVDPNVYRAIFCLEYLKKLDIFGWIGIFAITGMINIYVDTLHGVVVQLLSRTVLPYMLWFLVGTLVYRYKDKMIPILADNCLRLVCLYVVYYIVHKLFNITFPGFYCSVVGGVALPILAIAIVYRIGDIKIKIDLSYQMYLYHWIIINIMISSNMFYRYNWVICLFVFVISTMTLSFLSYKIKNGILVLK